MITQYIVEQQKHTNTNKKHKIAEIAQLRPILNI